MTERLATLARETDPRQARYLNVERAAWLRAELGDGLPAPDRLERHAELARELLRAGQPLECIAEIDRIHQALKAHAVQVGPALIDSLLELQAVAWLRVGEQENCVLSHSTESCILPIQGGGVHRAQRGSRAAVEILAQLLERHPDRPSYRWLLNLGYMTLGEYPDGVPSRWLIPPHTYRSTRDFPRFPEVASAVGLDHVSLSGGVVIEDLDGDQRLDVMVSSWGLRDPLRWFRNQGDGRFAERSSEAGLTGQVGGLNLIHADPDNDGDADLLVLRGAWLGKSGHHPNSLLLNDGHGRFRDVTEQAGLLSFHPTQAAAWGDFDNDGWLDLFIGNESGGSELHPSELYRNLGNGTFRNVAAEVGLDHIGFVKAALWGDIDNDGDLDLFLSQLEAPNVLFRNPGPAPAAAPGAVAWGRFEDISAEAGILEPLRSFPAWFFDYDNDGDLDLMVASFANFDGNALDVVAAAILGQPSTASRSRLYRNRGDGRFDDVSRETGMDLPLLAMGSNYGDLDNDGWLDAYFGTGEPNPGTLLPNIMMRNDGGRRFEDVTYAGGFGNVQKGHGVAFADLDNDGDQDIYAVMGGAYTGDVYADLLFENPGNHNRWLKLQLEGVRANRAAIGARVHLVIEDQGGGRRHLHRLVGTGGSFGSSPLRIEAGLGPARRIVEVEVRWPGSGTVDVHRDLPLDRMVRLREGDPGAVVVPLPAIRLASQGKAAGHVHSAKP